MKGSDYGSTEYGNDTGPDDDYFIHWQASTRADGAYTLKIDWPHVYGEKARIAEEAAAAELTRIVTAVNAHDELVAALESAAKRICPACREGSRFREYTGLLQHTSLGPCRMLYPCQASEIHAALAKAKGDTNEQENL